MTRCPSCNGELPGEFAFCPFCGVDLAAKPAPVQMAERKIVSCFFCDLVGFTALAERLDPEDVRAVLGPYHARVRAELERHGGTVEKFIGDAVMAVFGAPVAHEDDPERAVRAALAIRNTAREEGVELRIGIATGEALVTLGAHTTEGEGLASGDVVNTAARLQSAAPVFGVLVGETTHRATRHAIDYREAEPVQAKGKAEPVRAWEAIDARSRLGTEVLDHVERALVGREGELNVLRSALERVRVERSPQLVTLVGVPGIGKSRMLFELSRLADADPDLITWRQGRCLAYGEGVTFWALAEIVKAQAGILEADSDDEASRKLKAAVEAVVADRLDAAWIEARLRPLAGLGEGELAGDRRGETFTAWRRFFEALADQRMLVLVFEDLQWADDGLLDFIDELADWANGVPLLLVCTARPELLSRRPSWGGGKLNAATIALSPLSDRDTALLIAQVLERAVLPAATQQTLLERAEGNPLYAEQFALLYAERGTAEELPLPESLQGIVAARLDGLPPAEKALLQDASVVGKVFWTGCLDRDPVESAPLLHALARKAFLRPQRRSSVEGEEEHAFAHVLVRDVAYGQIPRGERARKHRRVAEWIESLGRPDDHAETVAYHWRASLELTRASGGNEGDVVERTRLALRDAGDRAASLNAPVAAQGYYAEALALWPTGDAAARADLQFRLARALNLAGTDSREQALAEARDELAAAGDRAQAAEAGAFLARIAWHRGDHEASLDHLAAAVELVADAPPSPAKTRVLAIAARQRTLAGERELGERLAEKALTMARELGLVELQAHALTTVGTARMDDGAGREPLERALEIARATNSPDAATILINLAVEAAFAGDIRREDALLAEACATAERFGDLDGVRFATGDRIVTLWMLGYWDEAFAIADAFIAECTSSPHYLEGSARQIRATMRAARGDLEGALADTERSLELARKAGDPQAVLPALASGSSIYVALGRLGEARTLAQEVIEFSGTHLGGEGILMTLTPDAALLGIEVELRELLERAPSISFVRAARAAAAGDHSGAADLLAGFGARTLEARHRLAAAELLFAAGRRAAGEAELSRALEFYRSVGAVSLVERGEELLAATA